MRNNTHKTRERESYLLSCPGAGLKPGRAQLYTPRNTAAAARATRRTDMTATAATQSTECVELGGVGVAPKVFTSGVTPRTKTDVRWGGSRQVP